MAGGIAQRQPIALQPRRIDVLQRLHGEIFLAGEVVIERGPWGSLRPGRFPAPRSRGSRGGSSPGRLWTGSGRACRCVLDCSCTENMTGRLAGTASSMALIQPQPWQRWHNTQGGRKKRDRGCGREEGGIRPERFRSPGSRQDRPARCAAKRARTRPSLPTRNFSKFQLMSPGNRRPHPPAADTADDAAVR